MDVLKESAGYLSYESLAPYVPKEDEKNGDSENLKPEDIFESIHELPQDHQAVSYLRSRMIPERSWSRIFYTPIFKEVSRFFNPERFKDFKRDEERIIFPLMRDGKMHGFQGRSIEKDARVRYYTIMRNLGECKLFGLDSVDSSKTVILVEGPIDSLFLENSVALSSVNNYTQVPFKDRVFYMDQEPRNRDVVSVMRRMLNSGERVVMLPEEYHERDVNELVLDGMTPSRIQELALNNAYQGQRGLMRLATWKKI